MLPLTTRRLVLRRFHRQDVPAFHAYRSDPEVARYQGWSPDLTLDDAVRFVAAAAATPWGRVGTWLQVALDRDGVLVGDLAVHTLSETEVELGITLGRDAWGQGLAREALDGLLLALASRGVIREARAVVDARNLPAQRLFERLGFHVTARHAVHFKGEDGVEWTYTRGVAPLDG